jgi:ankyrin repeat protein
LVKEFGADIHQANLRGSTPLHIVAQNGNLAAAECLVRELGADVNKLDDNDCTPLYLASQNGHLRVVRLLAKEVGANVNQSTLVGTTPLTAAVAQEHRDVITSLLKNGANAQAHTTEFGTAANYSKLHGAPTEQTAYLEARTHCAKSGCSGAGLKKCAGCLEVFFCSKDCQVAAWPAHKADCKRRVKSKKSKMT